MRLVTALLLALILYPTSSTPTERGCSTFESLNGECTSITNTGTEVDITGVRQDDGEQDSPAPDTRTGDTPPPPEDEPCIVDTALQRACSDYSVVSLGDDVEALTLTDLASFAPAPLHLTVEPAGIGIVGLPTNLFAPATVHTATGALFDLPVTVRFTPASFTFAYGDGTTRTTSTGGTLWTTTASPQFTATPTSHAYRARGRYAASATVHYAAAVDFGNGWIPVAGLLDIPTPTTTVAVFELRTALVAQHCLENPAGPGC